VTDDLLDFTSTEETLGKHSGADLLGGKVTLPLIHLIAKRPEERAMVEAIMEEGNYQAHSRENLRESLASVGAIDLARDLADDYASAARSALDHMPPSDFCDCLRAIPGYVLERER
jgi:geranylgeranyl pyrophosphate synthase